MKSEVEKHWAKMSKIFGSSKSLAMEDDKIRQKEWEFINQELSTTMATSLTDLGMGNGYLLEDLQLRYPHLLLQGLEYSKPLLETAMGRQLKATLIHGDIRQKWDLPSTQWTLCKRVLINLENWQQQQQALGHIVEFMPKGGHLLIIESFQEAFDNLQEARTQSGLFPLRISGHNNYLPSEFFSFAKELGLTKVPTQMPAHSLSSHFFVKRVLHPLIRKDGTPVKNTHVANFLIEAFAPNVGEYGPIQFYHFVKGL